ncbi:MAG: alpha/beta fold hydrolase [Rubrivivax sp.]|nr:alpha/beta fold hydrolase [Rubrivivax sp.]
MQRLDDPFLAPTPPRQRGLLAVGDGHAIAWQDSGSPDALPMVVAHGGPGGSMLQGITRFADARSWRIVQFDQRGCGASTPAGELSANTLQHTIADMERLREHLGITRWVVSGGSWGSTVALAYAQQHPERCLGLFVMGTWLARERDFQWWFHGVRTLFPELWEQFAAAVPEAERNDLRGAYCSRILGTDARLAAEFATRLYLYEEGFMHFGAPLQPSDPVRGPAYGRIFAHYAQHHFFLQENQLVRDAQRIAHLPLMQVCGRYDACTTPDNAYDLAQALPHSRLKIVAGAGHYPTEPAMAAMLPGAIAEFAAWVRASQP